MGEGGRQMDEKSLHEVNQYNDVIFPVGLYEVTRDSIVPKGLSLIHI